MKGKNGYLSASDWPLYPVSGKSVLLLHGLFLMLLHVVNYSLPLKMQPIRMSKIVVYSVLGNGWLATGFFFSPIYLDNDGYPGCFL